MEMAKADEKKKDPTLEWTLKYMTREIPTGAKESIKDAFDYSKHQKDFKCEAELSMYTKGHSNIMNGSGALSKATAGSGTIYFALVPCNAAPRFGSTKLYGAFQKRGDKDRAVTQRLFDPSKIRYDEEMKLSSHGSVKNDPKNPDRLLKGRVEVWILIVKKVNRDISKMASELDL